MTVINITKPIILTGMMGCGKSLVGKNLAERLNIPFFDLDTCIEKQENMTI